MPWVYTLAAVGVVALAAATGTLPDWSWWLPVAVAGAVAGAIGWRRNGLPPAFVAVYAFAVGALTAAHLRGDGSTKQHLDWLHSVSDLVVGLALAGMLGSFLYRRNGSFDRRDLVDVLCMLAGAVLTAWILTSPLVYEHEIGLGLALLAGAYLPISLLLVTFVVDVAITGPPRNRSLRLVTSATAANVAAATLTSLVLAERIPASLATLATALFAAAFLLMGAGMVHPDVTKILERRPDTPDRVGNTSRLVVMAASFTAPAVAMATTAPANATDLAVRTVAALCLMATVTTRLWMALHDDQVVRSELLHQLNRDQLTNLPNRTRFVEVVTDVLESTWRSEVHPTLVKLNLDRFKNINDTLGHADANRVLATVAERLAAAVATFGGTVARSGGDDFVAIDATTGSTAEAMARAETIRDALRPPIVIGESTMFVTASIGVAQAPRSRTLTAEEFMRRADIAAHRAKATGRNRVLLFDDSMQAELTQRMEVEHALHGAIGRQEMRLYHQPIVDIVTGRVAGFEALMRWQRPDGTIVPPFDFIPIAEETGIITELGAWALGDALRELHGWIDAGIVGPDATMSVNVSPRQVADPAFADIVQGALDTSGVSPSLLWIEITESMMLDEPEVAERTLRQICKMGVRIALDDFGTGYSSLSLLQRFPIQRIKIDRAFVNGVAEEGNDRSLVRTVIAMAKSLDLDLVAEGVETVEQLEALRGLGCDKAQGYLISRPVPVDAMRSTMSALRELAELSMFTDPAPAPPSPPVRKRDVSYTPHLIGGPIGTSSNRPLGQPII